MTEAEVIKIVKNVMAGYNTKPSAWAVKAGTIEKAIAAGITADGERPGGVATREEVMQMILKALAVQDDLK